MEELAAALGVSAPKLRSLLYALAASELFRGLEALVDLLVGPLTEPADLLEGDVGSQGPAPLSGKG